MQHFRRTAKLIGTIGMALALCFGCGGGSSSIETPSNPPSDFPITPQFQPVGDHPGTVLPDDGPPVLPPPADPAPIPPPPRVILPVQAPLFDRALVGSAMDEGWLSSPAAVDLDGDGAPEIIAARTRTLYVWHPDGTLFWKASPPISRGRIWGPPVVVDLDGDGRPEIAVGSGNETISVWNWDGKPKAGWPVVLGTDSEKTIREVRSLAAGRLSDGRMALLASRTRKNNKVPVAFLFDAAGKRLPSWPQLTATKGCTLLPATGADCFEAGTYNQNVAFADFDGDGASDLIVGYDNIYIGVFHQDGAPFATDPVFSRPFFPGIPAYHDYALAKKGSGPNGADRSEFTDSPPVVADLDGDGKRELVIVGDREHAGDYTKNFGNALFVLHPDGTRAAGFERPFETGLPLVHDDVNPQTGNIVDVTAAPAVADLDGDGKKEILFQSYDGNLYAVRYADIPEERLIWKFSFAETGARFASEPVIGDLNGDGRPEILFTTYETVSGKGALIVLDADGKLLFRKTLPGRGAMAAPTLADIDGDGELEILINLKDGSEGVEIYHLPGSLKGDALPWPTGRGNFLRNGDATG
jgi:hypothetical protein